jgi:hypothetical protein
VRKASTTALVLFIITSFAYAQAPALPGWNLVWSDEFNYTGHPDPTKWGYEEGYVRHNELQYYTVNRPENPRVDGHNLLIELRKETPESFLPTSINDEWHRYTAAVDDMYNKFHLYAMEWYPGHMDFMRAFFEAEPRASASGIRDGAQVALLVYARSNRHES